MSGLFEDCACVSNKAGHVKKKERKNFFIRNVFDGPQIYDEYYAGRLNNNIICVYLCI